jgi:hypothetical protein
MFASTRLLGSLPQLVSFAALCAALVCAELSPSRFERLMQEDGPAEWATFLAFGLAGGWGAHALWKRRVQGRLDQLALWAVVGFCLFVAGEEISWGQRIIGFRPPALFLEHNYQQESNLHNLLKGIFDTRWMVFLIAFVYGVVAPYLAHVTRFPRVLAAPLASLPWFAAVAWLEFSYPYELVGELAELMLGLSFVCDVAARVHGDAVERAPRVAARTALVQVAALVGAFALVPMYEFALSLHSDDLVRHTRADLAQLAARIQAGETLQPQVFRKRDVHKRIYTAVKAGYLALERDEFYLDAWNSPYWVSFKRTDTGRGTLVLYSFGPNRKRDIDPARPSEAGDDVQLAFEVSARAHAQAL